MLINILNAYFSNLLIEKLLLKLQTFEVRIFSKLISKPNDEILMKNVKVLKTKATVCFNYAMNI